MYSTLTPYTIRRDLDGACVPVDPLNADYQAYLRWVAQGNVPTQAPEPDLSGLVAENIAAIQQTLDATAQASGYDSVLSACTYAAQPEGAPFQAEGAAFLAWRSAVWVQAYATLARVQAGEIPLPTRDESIAQIPPLSLP